MNLAPGVSLHEYQTKQRRKQREEDIKKGILLEENSVLDITDFDIKSTIFPDVVDEKKNLTISSVSTVTNIVSTSSHHDYNQHNWIGRDNKNNDSNISNNYHDNNNDNNNNNSNNNNNNNTIVTNNNNYNNYHYNNNNDGRNNMKNNINNSNNYSSSSNINNTNINNGYNNNVYNKNHTNYILQQQQSGSIPNVHNVSSSHLRNVLHPQAYSSVDRKEPPQFVPPPKFSSFAAICPTQHHPTQQPTQQHPQIEEYFARLKNSQLDETEQMIAEKIQICNPVNLGEICTVKANNFETSSLSSSTSISSERRGVKRPHV